MNTAIQKIDPNAPIGESVNDVKKLFQSFTSDFERSLPKHISMDSMLSAAINSCRKNPKLLGCTQASMISSLMMCASTGLIPDDFRQECHLIPYWNGQKRIMEVQWQAGYRGLIKLARQSGEIAFIDSYPVYENDTFYWELGTNAHIKHIPCRPEERGDVIYVYAVATYRDQTIPKQFEVMTWGEIDAVKQRALSKLKKEPTHTPWITDPTEMARKTPIRRFCKRLPMSPELALALDLDNRVASGEEQPLADVVHQIVESTLDKRTATDKLADTIGASEESEEQAVPEEPTLIEQFMELSKDVLIDITILHTGEDATKLSSMNKGAIINLIIDKIEDEDALIELLDQHRK